MNITIGKIEEKYTFKDRTPDIVKFVCSALTGILFGDGEIDRGLREPISERFLHHFFGGDLTRKSPILGSKK